MSKFSKRDLILMDTIEQSWSGDELKMDSGDMRVWLTHRENRAYDGDYQIELLIDGCWKRQVCFFE